MQTFTLISPIGAYGPKETLVVGAANDRFEPILTDAAGCANVRKAALAEKISFVRFWPSTLLRAPKFWLAAMTPLDRLQRA